MTTITNPTRQSIANRDRLWLAVLAIVGIATRCGLLLRSNAEISVKPYLDDSFYLFSIARNVVHGHGVSVDGVHLTNGFQPLILLFYAPLFWLTGSDDWLAIRLTIVLHALLFVAGLVLLYCVVRKLDATQWQSKRFGITPAIIAAGVWTVSISYFLHDTNGLETELYAVTLLGCMLSYISCRDSTSIFRWVASGVILGLTVLTRIDAAVLVALMVGIELLRSRSFGWNRRILPIIMGSVAVLVSLPWWIYNYVNFGSLMPISGQAENIWPSLPFENIHRLIQDVGDIACLLFYSSFSYSLTVHIFWTAVAVAIWILIFWKCRVLTSMRRPTRLGSLMPFFLFGIFLAVYYTFFFAAPHFIARYLHPVRIIWLIVVSLAIPVIAQHITNQRGASRWISKAFVALFLVMGIAFSADRYANLFHCEDQAEFYQFGQWANEHSNDKIGMLQSGIASFIAPNVTNLDGKVNRDALVAHQRGKLGEYIRDQHFTYLTDWKPFVEDLAKMAAGAGVRFDSIGYVGRLQIMKRMAP